MLHTYMSAEKHYPIISAVEHVGSLCTTDTDSLYPLGSKGLRLCRSYPLGYAALFSRVVEMRTDLPEREKHNLTLDAQKTALKNTKGQQPPLESHNNISEKWKCENCFCNIIWRLFPQDSPQVQKLM